MQNNFTLIIFALDQPAELLISFNPHVYHFHKLDIPKKSQPLGKIEIINLLFHFLFFSSNFLENGRSNTNMIKK